MLARSASLFHHGPDRRPVPASQILRGVGRAPKLHPVVVALEDDRKGLNVIECVADDLVAVAAG